MPTQVTASNADVPLAVVSGVEEFLWRHAEGGTVALELGDRRKQLHLQGAFKISCNVPSLTKVRALVRRCLAIKPQHGLQGACTSV